MYGCWQGTLASEQPWFNLALQGVQPLFQNRILSRLHFGADGAQLSVLQASSCQETSWQGGSCLVLHGELRPCLLCPVQSLMIGWAMHASMQSTWQ